MRYLILLALSAAAWAQPNFLNTIKQGSPPGGIGGPCIGASRVGYLDTSGNLITCKSSVWTVTGGGSGTTTINGVACALNGSCTVLPAVTNDAQTKAAVMPNTAPSAGQVPAGNAGGTAYAPVSLSGDCTMTSAGVMSCPTLHAITFSLDGGGSAITTGALGQFIPVDFACTINRIDIAADQSGSITIDIWKKATAIPGSGDKISGSAPITLSSAQLSQAGSISGWTTAVAVGDVFGGTVATASTVTKATAIIWCK